VFFEAHLLSLLKTWQLCSAKSYKVFIAILLLHPNSWKESLPVIAHAPPMSTQWLQQAIQ